MKKLLVMPFCLLCLGGCASFLNEGVQAISVRAVCSGGSVPAQCTAENSRGRWAFDVPGQVVVRKDVYALNITCKSVLVDRHTVAVEASLQANMLGNAVVGGLVGSAVDIMTARGLQYPASVDVVYPACR